MSRITRIKTTLSGFPEWTPSQRLVEQRWLRTIENIFEVNGFTSLDTRCVEPTDVLDSKGEASKETYGIGRRDDQGSPKDEQLGLRFDLTVPLARYITSNASAVSFPFRRYQVAKVWRGERPQEGRFREFYQADIDIVGKDSLADYDEIEVPLVMAQVFESLRELGMPPVAIRINSRLLIEGFYLSIGIRQESIPATMRAIDKLDKSDPYRVFMDLMNGPAGLTVGQAQMCLMLAEQRGISDPQALRDLTFLPSDSEMVQVGLETLCALLSEAKKRGLKVEADLSIARGLDYYTGVVFESTMEGYETSGSVCSGGRYDSLAQDKGISYPGVGISFGITRALSLLFADGLDSTRSTPTVVLIALPSSEDRSRCYALATTLRSQGISAEVNSTDAKYGKQIKYASNKGIPFVWFPGADGQPDQVRDIRVGEQVDADVKTWRPEEQDLVPQVIFANRAE